MIYPTLERLERQQRDKIHARNKVAQAVKNGTLKREPCMCGATRVQGHHADYSKPLDVIWMCHKHHAYLHKMQNKAAADADEELIPRK